MSIANGNHRLTSCDLKEELGLYIEVSYVRDTIG